MYIKEISLGHEDFPSLFMMFRTYSYKGLNNDEFINCSSTVKIKPFKVLPLSPR